MTHLARTQADALGKLLWSFKNISHEEPIANE
jgi:hypothetical protein